MRNSPISHTEVYVSVLMKLLGIAAVFFGLCGCSLQVDLSNLTSLLNNKVIVQLNSSATPQTNLSSLPIVVQFSQPVSGIDASYFTSTNGSISGLSGADATYTFDFIPSSDGPASVSFPESEVTLASTATDEKKKTNSTEIHFTIDRIQPTVILATTAPNPTNVSTIPLTVVFSETISGLTSSDFSVTGASITSLTGSGSSYSLVLTALTSGAVTISLTANTVQDAAGNSNTVSNSVNLVYDSTLAVPVLSSTAPSNNGLSLIPITLDFSSVSVTGLTLSDFTVVNGTASNLVGSGSSYTLDLTPSSDGTVSIQLPANTVANGMSSGNVVSNLLTFNVDTVPPTVAISAPTPSLGRSTASFVFTVTYTGASVISLSNGDISFGGTATAGCSAAVTGSGSTTRTVTVTGCSGNGTANISVAANSSQDLAGNQSLAFGPSSNITVDNTAPTLVITGPSPSSGPTSTEFVWTLTYSGADVYTLNSADITLAGTGKTGCTVTAASVSGNIGTVKVKNCTDDPGSVKINVAANTASDSAGNQVLANTSATAATISNSVDITDPAQANNIFITTWDTTKTSAGSSTSTQVQLPLVGGYTYNFSVDWGDGTAVQTITSTTAVHTYSAPGVYDVKILGTLPRFIFNGSGDRLKILDVKQWGNNSWNNMVSMFRSCANLQISATDAPNLSGLTSLNSMFYGATAFNGSINHWNTSSIVNMGSMFMNAVAFNQPLGNWVTTNVTDMSYMFYGAETFNQPIGTWNTSAATNMSYMFSTAYSFDQPIGTWNTGNVINMSYMFKDSTFNKDISGWNTAKVTNMSYMFQNNKSFNQPIGSWDTSKVTTMGYMFNNASSFNQPIGSWVTSLVTDMSQMFNRASSFNQPIGSWDTGKVATFSYMFTEAYSFNQPIETWNVALATDMSQMFSSASSFNQPLAGWNTIKVTKMTSMFQLATSFNQPLGTWNTAAVTRIDSMFSGATAFNQDLSAWNVAAVTNAANFDTGASSYYKARPTGKGTAFIDPYPNIALDGSEPSNAFVVVFRTDFPGTLNPTLITLPAAGAGLNIDVDWGDGSGVQNFTSTASHTYGSAGKYKVTITGTFPSFAFNNMGDTKKIIDVLQWGNNPWTSVVGMFRGCSNLQISATDAPNLSGVTSLSMMFDGAFSFNSNINHWDTSTITDMSYMFQQAYAFNQPLGSWNTAALTNTVLMFNEARAFNRPIGTWDVSHLTNFTRMFQKAYAFNQSIGAWDTSSATVMQSMFEEARAFNRPIGSWNMSGVTNVSNMFYSAAAFNQPLGNWNTSNIVNMSGLFTSAYAFNQDLSSWNTASVTNMSSIFAQTAFDYSIDSWNTSNVTNMFQMFYQNWAFNHPLPSWDTSKVTDMGNMFYQAYTFNQNLSTWSVGSVVSKPPSGFATGNKVWVLPKPTW